jgi:AcrR family transcriptional regulator
MVTPRDTSELSGTPLAGHPVLSQAKTLDELLRFEVTPGDKAGLFLSVVVRTQGARIAELNEALLCLAAQTGDDFEVLVMGHNLDVDARAQVEQAIECTPLSLRSRTRLIAVEGGTRARPLHEGFEAARGEYAVALDDDDIVFAHWVETFAALRRTANGRVLRARCVWQQAQRVTTDGRPATSAGAALELPHVGSFSLTHHLWQNSTPFMSVAFPLWLHRRGFVWFSTNLTTLEDWDYLIRASSLAGVIDSDEVTSIYRRWTNSENSLALHTDQEWVDNLAELERGIDGLPLLLPAGETATIRALLAQVDNPSTIDRRRRESTETLRAEALALVESRSWKLGALMRGLGRLGGRRPGVSSSALHSASRTELLTAIDLIRSSRSWHLARLLRPME